MKNELQIRSKALQDPEFPNEGIIKEFLIPKDNIEELKQEWSKPDLSLLTVRLSNNLLCIFSTLICIFRNILKTNYAGKLTKY